MKIYIIAGWTNGYEDHDKCNIALINKEDVDIPVDVKQGLDIKDYLTLKGFLKIKHVFKDFDMKNPYHFVRISSIFSKKQYDDKVNKIKEIINQSKKLNTNQYITKELLLNNSFKEHYCNGFADFGEYHTYTKKYYSTIYNEEVLAFFKTPVNPQDKYFYLIIDNDLFETIAQIRVMTIEDVNKVFEIVGINERL